MHSNARMYSSNVVSYINVDGHEPMPVYGCGKSKKALKFYDMERGRNLGLCMDWVHNRCVYHPSECKYTHAMPPAKSEAELRKMKWRKGQSAVNNPRTNKKKLKVETSLFGKKCVRTKALNRPVKSSRAQRVTSSRAQEDKPILSDMSTSGSKTGSDLPEVPPPTEEITWDNDANEPKNDDEAPVVGTVLETKIYAPADFDPVHVAPPAVSMAEPGKAPEFEVEAPMDFEPAPPVFQAPVRDRHAILEPQLLALNAHAPSYSGSIMSEDQYQPMSTFHTPAQSTYKDVEYHQPTPMVQPTSYQMVQYVHPSALAALQEKNAQLTAQVNAHRAAQEKIHGEYQTELGKVQRETALLARLHERSIKRFEEEKSQLRHHYELHIAALCQQLEEARAENASRCMENHRLKAQATQVQAPAQVPEEEIVQPVEENTLFHSAPCDGVVPVTTAADEEPRALPPADEPKVEQEPAEQPTVVVEPTKVVVPKVVEQLADEAAVVVEPADQPTVVDEPAEVPTVAEKPAEEPQVHKTSPAPAETEKQPTLAVKEPTPVALNPKKDRTLDPWLVAEAAKDNCWTNRTNLKPRRRSSEAAIAWIPTNTSKPASTRTTTTVKSCASSTTSSQTKRCIFKVYDMDVGRKEGVCYHWLCGLCKCEDCASHTGCQLGHNCGYHHKMPSVKKQKAVAREELKYRQRQSGVKKTRMSKRERFNRNNRLSLADLKRQKQTAKRRVKVCGTVIAARKPASAPSYWNH